MKYYFASGNEQRGPHTLQELASFGLRPDTLVWREGMPDWVRADTLPELMVLIPVALTAGVAQEPGAAAQAALSLAPDLGSAATSTPPPAEPRALGYQNPSTAAPASGMAVASLVLGIVSIPGMCTYGIVGIPCAILAIVFGFIARGKAKRNEAGGAGIALAGIICGMISVAIVIIFLIVIGVIIIVAAAGK